MRLLADENVHGRVVASLRDRGYPIGWIRDLAAGVADRDLLLDPRVQGAVLLTNDRDFGELIFREHLPPPLAVLYTRTPHRDWQLTAALVAAELVTGV